MAEALSSRFFLGLRHGKRKAEHLKAAEHALEARVAAIVVRPVELRPVEPGLLCYFCHAVDALESANQGDEPVAVTRSERLIEFVLKLRKINLLRILLSGHSFLPPFIFSIRLPKNYFSDGSYAIYRKLPIGSAAI